MRAGILAVALIGYVSWPAQAGGCGNGMLSGTLVVERTADRPAGTDLRQPTPANVTCAIATNAPDPGKG